MEARHDSVANFLLFVLSTITGGGGALVDVARQQQQLSVAAFAAARTWVPHGLNLAQLTTRHTALLRAGFSVRRSGRLPVH